MQSLIRALLLMLCLSVVSTAQAQVLGSYEKYIELKPFVTNFGEVRAGPLRFVKAEITLQLADDGSHLDVEKHTAHIRNDLIFLLNEQQESDLATIEAQAVLAQKALRTVQAIMVAETGKPHVEDLFFTSLVIQ